MNVVNLFFLIAGVMFFQSIECISQTFPQWGGLKQGRYQVGYSDTIIFKNDELFSFYSFHEAKPFYVGIWYPSQDNSQKPFMQFKDYFNFKSDDKYVVLSDSLKAAFQSVLMESGILIDITPRDSIVHVPMEAKHKKLYNDILNTTVGTKYRLAKPNKKYPCIIYHHGAQSISFDNNVFCEYMASHGFIVISANFNLPDESGKSLLTPSTDKRFGLITDFQFIIDFARRQAFVDTTRMTAVGHSLGAQVMLQYDNQEKTKPFQKIISLHTTLEHYSVSDARKYWPNFEYLFNGETELSTTTAFLFAPALLVYRTRKDSTSKKEVYLGVSKRYPEFFAFRNNTTTPYTFITTEHPIKHDGFVSIGNIRYALSSKYSLSDQNEILKQQAIYEKIVILVESIITSPSSDSSRQFEKLYRTDFKFEYINAK